MIYITNSFIENIRNRLMSQKLSNCYTYEENMTSNQSRAPSRTYSNHQKYFLWISLIPRIKINLIQIINENVHTLFLEYFSFHGNTLINFHAVFDRKAKFQL